MILNQSVYIVKSIIYKINLRSCDLKKKNVKFHEQ